jgi:hypothetical protein
MTQGTRLALGVVLVAAIVVVVGHTARAATPAPNANVLVARPVGMPSPGNIPVTVQCPVPQVTVGVKNPPQLAAPWSDNPFLMDLRSVGLTTVGGKPGIKCVYLGTGREWEVSRALEPNYSSCTPQAKSFLCVLK